MSAYQRAPYWLWDGKRKARLPRHRVQRGELRVSIRGAGQKWQGVLLTAHLPY